MIEIEDNFQAMLNRHWRLNQRRIKCAELDDYFTCQENLPVWERDPETLYSFFFGHTVEIVKGKKGASYIYFIEAVGIDRVKIGYTTSLKNRVIDLQVASPVLLRVLMLFRGNQYSESVVQRLFKNDRLHGEWFTYSDRMKAFVNHMKSSMHSQHKKMVDKINSKCIDRKEKA